MAGEAKSADSQPKKLGVFVGGAAELTMPGMVEGDAAYMVAEIADAELVLAVDVHRQRPTHRNSWMTGQHGRQQAMVDGEFEQIAKGHSWLDADDALFLVEGNKPVEQG